MLHCIVDNHEQLEKYALRARVPVTGRIGAQFESVFDEGHTTRMPDANILPESCPAQTDFEGYTLKAHRITCGPYQHHSSESKFLVAFRLR